MLRMIANQSIWRSASVRDASHTSIGGDCAPLVAYPEITRQKCCVHVTYQMVWKHMVNHGQYVHVTYLLR